MFEASLVESSGALKSKSSRYLWFTGSLNAAIVAVMILIPLLYPEALPKTAMTAMLTAPPPPAAPPPTPPRVVTAVARVTPALNPFTAPTRIPRTIDMAHEDPPPPTTGSGVIGMGTTAAGGSGVMDAIGLGTPPPMVKPVVPKVVGLARVSSGVTAGMKLSGSQPVYPAIARAAHVSGAVVLHAIISKTGAIQSLQVVSGPEMLRGSAVAAVQDWKYRPYMLNGDATEVDTTITVNFSFGG